MASGRQETVTSLLDLRDELAVTRQLVVALWLACQAPHLPEAERRALSALANLVRERFEGCLASIDGMNAPAPKPGSPKTGRRRSA